MNSPHTQTNNILIVSKKEPTPEKYHVIKELFNADHLKHHPPKDIELGLNTRFCSAVVISQDTKNDIDTWFHILGLIKNLYAENILFLRPSNTLDNDEARLRSLGFFMEEMLQLGDSHYTCNSYNLSAYNRKRTWNNARFWANPENFHKHRW